MISRRIIPCLDIKDGRTVKGTNFKQLKDAGDPIELAKKYAQNGADELVFLDITATLEKRKTLVTLVRQIGQEIDIPFTVGGGINTVDLVDEILRNGADKVAINSAAINRPELINEIAEKYGSQCVVVAIDAKFIDNNWKVFKSSGTINTELDLLDWSEEVVKRGAGEILFTSMDKDGTKSGFELDALIKMTNRINVPIIASGGAGGIHDFVALFQHTKVTAGLAASIFHYGEVDIPTLKTEIQKKGILIRI